MSSPELLPGQPKGHARLEGEDSRPIKTPDPFSISNSQPVKAGWQGLASAPLEATPPGFSVRNPSGIPAAAVVDRGALVSSSFPAR